MNRRGGPDGRSRAQTLGSRPTRAASLRPMTQPAPAPVPCPPTGCHAPRALLPPPVDGDEPGGDENTSGGQGPSAALGDFTAAEAASLATDLNKDELPVWLTRFTATARSKHPVRVKNLLDHFDADSIAWCPHRSVLETDEWLARQLRRPA